MATISETLESMSSTILVCMASKSGTAATAASLQASMSARLADLRTKVLLTRLSLSSGSLLRGGGRSTTVNNQSIFHCACWSDNNHKNINQVHTTISDRYDLLRQIPSLSYISLSQRIWWEGGAAEEWSVLSLANAQENFLKIISAGDTGPQDYATG